MAIACWKKEPPQVPAPAASRTLFEPDRIVTKSTFLSRGTPIIPMCEEIVDPNRDLVPLKENEAVPPLIILLPLTSRVASIVKLFLTVVIPPCPAIVISEAFVAKSNLEALPELEKKLTSLH